jgi:hypothetical protein
MMVKQTEHVFISNHTEHAFISNHTEHVFINNHTATEVPPRFLPREKSDKYEGVLCWRVDWRVGVGAKVTFLGEGFDEGGE